MDNGDRGVDRGELDGRSQGAERFRLDRTRIVPRRDEREITDPAVALGNKREGRQACDHSFEIAHTSYALIEVVEQERDANAQEEAQDDRNRGVTDWFRRDRLLGDVCRCQHLCATGLRDASGQLEVLERRLVERHASRERR